MSVPTQKEERTTMILEQWVTAGEGVAPPAASPLAPDTVAALATGEPSAAGVRLEVAGSVGLLTIRADPARVALADALDRTLGLALPERLSSVARGAARLRWMSPDEWLLSCPVETVSDTERRLGDATPADDRAARAAVTNVTGGWCVLVLGGPAAREVLAKSTSLDVDPRAFPAGRVASTVFAKTVATLGNLGDGRYEIVCRRSFADYVARWIGAAAHEHGLVVA